MRNISEQVKYVQSVGIIVCMPQPEIPASKARTIAIDAERAGQRLDNYLLGQLKGVPRSLVYRLLRTGQVRVNGGRAKPAYRLQPGDAVRIPPVHTTTREPPRADPRRARELLDAVLYEDQDLLAINKPSGLAVHGGSRVRVGIVEILRAAGRPQLELVHRLDRETSGCLLLAKRRAALQHLHAELRAGAVRKEYLTLVAGQWRHPEIVDLPLRRHSGEQRASSAGKAAITNFEPFEFLADTTLTRVLLQTGRTHQIRVHAAARGHPVAGDTRYGDFAFNREMRGLGLRRMFLHAASVTCGHAGGLTVEAPLPAALQDVLQRLRQR
ncbi:MAG: RluA family pseudouridine synthase [Gammaproteobacteria bacterium]|nr:RluA family pseudouridine synthase [Gammaproteobacteria bacterium]